MIEEHFRKKFYDKIKFGAKIAIYDAGIVARRIYEDIKTKRPDVEVKYFIDKNQTGEIEGKEIIPLADADKIKDTDIVVGYTNSDYMLYASIFQYYDINYLAQEKFLEYHYFNPASPLNDENFKKVIDIFKDKEDKELFELIFCTRACLLDDGMQDYANKNHGLKRYCERRNLYKQYLEKIVKDKIRVIYDLGFFDGRNFLAYNKLLKNLEKIYAFEAIYNITKNQAMESIFKKENKVEIIEKALADREGEAVFCINKNILSGSALKEITTKKLNTLHYSDYEEKINLTSIDIYFKNNNIRPPDFIKTDIEGAEMSALKGAKETIEKYRPQLAISIYHSDSDFINIPLYLNKTLQDYTFKLGHYSRDNNETVLYAIPDELL